MTVLCWEHVSLALYLCVSLKCGVVQCVPLNLDDMRMFWPAQDVLAGERTDEFSLIGVRVIITNTAAPRIGRSDDATIVDTNDIFLQKQDI